MKKLTVACSLFISLGLSAQKYSNDFLNIGVGARNQAMGGAVAAHVSDVTAAFWNPAGLAPASHDLQLAFMHTSLFAGIANYDYGAVAIPLGSNARVLGVSLIRLGIDNIPNTLSLYNDDGTINYNNIKSFSAADYAGLFTYAQEIGKIKGLRVGGSAKVIHRTVGTFSTAWGFGLDLGVQYKMDNGLRLGLMCKDITGTFNAWDFKFTDREKQVLSNTNNEIPKNSVETTLPRFNFGAGYQTFFTLNKKAMNANGARPKKMSLTTELGFDVTTDGQRNTLVSTKTLSVDPKVGVELGYDNLVFLRGGVNNLQQARSISNINEKSWTFQPGLGMGINIKDMIRLDYALSNVGSQGGLLYSHVISLGVNLNRKQATQPQ